VIGWVLDLLEEHVLTPITVEAADPGVPEEFRVVLDPESTPIDVEPQEVDVTPITTVPVESDLTGSLVLRHTIIVAVDVQHGDPAEARRLRDGIVLHLILSAQAHAPDMFAAAADAASGQYVVAANWGIDWRPVVVIDTPIESAVVTFTVDTVLDR
jgi:hypothetical protein